MRIHYSRFPIVAAIFMAFMLSVVPEARAADPQPVFSPQSCSQNMQNGYYRNAQERMANSSGIFSRAQLMGIKTAYCFNTITQAAYEILGAITSSANGVNALLGGAIWTFIENAIFNIFISAINQICATALAAVNGAVAGLFSYVNNLLCLPLPTFRLGNLNFNVPNFGGGTCNGVQVIPMLENLGTTQELPGGSWNYMGLNRQY